MEWGNTEILLVPPHLIWTPDIVLTNRSVGRKRKPFEKKVFLATCCSWAEIIKKKTCCDFFASADWLFSDEQQHHMLVALWPDGKIQWSLGGVNKVFCDLDNTFFPFDTHVCWLKFENWRSRGKTICLS